VDAPSDKACKIVGFILRVKNKLLRQKVGVALHARKAIKYFFLAQLHFINLLLFLYLQHTEDFQVFVFRKPSAIGPHTTFFLFFGRDFIILNKTK
jgi:hypothetical protein